MKRIANTRMAGLIAALVPTLFSAGCANLSTSEKGGLIGAVAGAALGSTVGKGDGRTVAIVLGALGGKMVGEHIGRSMDLTDRRRLAYTLEKARTGQTSGWRNPDTGDTYAVTPTRTYSGQNQSPCREYTMEARIDGKPSTVIGQACRGSDGVWRTVPYRT